MSDNILHNLHEYKWRNLTQRQIGAAKCFSEKYNTTVSQAGKYLDYIFAYEKKQITKEDLENYTSIKVPTNKNETSN